MSGSVFHSKHWSALALVTILAFFVVGCGGSDSDNAFIAEDGTVIGVDPADPQEDVVTEQPQVSLLGGAIGGEAEPTTTLTPAETDQAGSVTTLALVLDRPAPEALAVNYAMLGNADAFSVSVNGDDPLDGQPLLISAGERVLPFTIQAIGRLFDRAELQILGGEGYAVGEGAAAEFEIKLDRLPLAALAPNSLEVPVGEFRNAAVILDPERPPAPVAGDGLRINYVLVGDPLAVQDGGDITERDSTGPVEGTDPVAGIVEVNNAEPLTIAPGDFAVTFQVRRQEPGSVTMILIGGGGYTVPEWNAPNAQLTIGAGGVLEFSGDGTDVVEFSLPSDGAVFFDLTHSGSENFIVRLRDGDANELAPSLANEIGVVDSTVVRNLDAGDYQLDITADGEWTANVRF